MNGDYAAAIAAQIDRVRIALARRMQPMLAEFAGNGITPANGNPFAMLRNLGPTRRASRAGIDQVFVYQSVSDAWDGYRDLADKGVVDLAADDVGLTPTGLELTERLLARADEMVTALWQDVACDFDGLLALSHRVADAAARDGGLAFHVLAPQYAPAGQSAAGAFAESLTPLRFHRFDAHIDAWRAAGLTAAQAQALDDADPRKAAIEADTNNRAAVPYDALDAAERDDLLRALERLPV